MARINLHYEYQLFNRDVKNKGKNPHDLLAQFINYLIDERLYDFVDVVDSFKKPTDEIKEHRMIDLHEEYHKFTSYMRLISSEEPIPRQFISYLLDKGFTTDEIVEGVREVIAE